MKKNVKETVIKAKHLFKIFINPTYKMDMLRKPSRGMEGGKVTETEDLKQAEDDSGADEEINNR